MRTRDAGQDDVDSLAELYAAFYREEGIDLARDAITRNLAAMIAHPSAVVLVAEENGASIGMVTASLSQGVEFGTTAEIEDLYLVPTARGRGLSRALLDAIETRCASAGASQAMVVVTPEGLEQGLARFYDKAGFENARRSVFLKPL